MTRPVDRRLRIGTRASRLARTQTAMVRARLQELHPTTRFFEVVVSTAGDRDTDTPLPELGGTGVFTDALERALLAGKIDLAVHSLKDVPVEVGAGLVLGAIGLREDPRDVLVSREGWTLETLPAGARTGTCSHRRAAQLLAWRPDLTLLPLRGNVETRVRRAHVGEYDAVVLAAAGLHRLGLASVIAQYLPLEQVLPAPGQGALAVQCRADDEEVRRLIAPLDDVNVRAATDAERSFLEGLGGGCTAPIAAYAEVARGRLRLRAAVSSLDGREMLRLEESGFLENARGLGLALADRARARGAEALLA